MTYKPDKCDRCGNDVEPWMTNIKSVYQCFGVVFICSDCGNKADNFIDYYGKKKAKDIRRLKLFLQSGKISAIKFRKDFSAMMNAGYYAK